MSRRGRTSSWPLYPATLGYRTILVADATAGRNDESHNATLTTIYRTFGDVRSTDDVLGLVAGGR